MSYFLFFDDSLFSKVVAL